MSSTTILRRPMAVGTPRRNDEELINRSLLDSLDAQADAEPLSSSDSEAAPGTIGSLSPSSTIGSPSISFQLGNIHSQLSRSDSPSIHQNHIRSPNGIGSFGQQHPQTHLYNNNNNNNMFSSDTISVSNGDTITPRAHEKFGFKTPTAYSAGRGRFSIAGTAVREGGREYGAFPEAFPTQPAAQGRQSFDALGQYDFNPPAAMPNGNINHSKVSFSNVDPFAAGSLQHHPSATRAGISIGPRQQLRSFDTSAQPAQPSPMHSQTPFGPHVSVGAPVSAALPAAATTVTGPVQPTSQEEISTIFVVGFPDDMQEREFQNMFTFSPGFEAATLKIPNKESTAYGANGRSAYPYNGPNDPYNLVTVNQGGVIVDNGRDLTTAWPSNQLEDAHFGPNSNQNPRKQIIGFAKFRTRQEALDARDILQGRRVDAEKGAVLKAEMAKKNLHTKRGVGQPGLGVPGSMLPGDVSLASASALNGLTAIVASASSGSEGTGRDLSSFGLGGLGQRRDQLAHLGGDNDRTAGLTGLGIQGVLASRGPRERAEDDERARRREKDNRMRGDSLRSEAAFEAFHSIPQHLARNASVNSVTKEESLENTIMAPEGHNLNAYTWNTAPGIRKVPSTLSAASATSHGHSHHFMSDSEHGSPTRADAGFESGPPSASSNDGFDGFDEPLSMERIARSIPQELYARAPSADSSNSGSSQVAQPDEIGISFSGLRLSAATGDASPELLPSPSSNTSSGPKANGADQNPPINTLYVGNLPTLPSLTHSNELEERLKNLFERCPGFRQLCFRQKNNGPMCFVEFDDTSLATKALNELYGHTLDGIIKNGGIRLSYSKNPLGVRTPTTGPGPKGFSPPTSSRPSDSSPFLGSSHFERHTHHDIDFVSNARREAQSVAAPPGLGHSYSLSPPPRFFSPPPPSGLPGLSGLAQSSTSFPRANHQAFGLPAPSSANHNSNGSNGFGSFGLSNGLSNGRGGDPSEPEAFFRARHSLGT